MNQSWINICIGIKRSLLQDDVVVSGNIYWEEILEQAKKQGIVAIVYDGLSSFMPEDVRTKWYSYFLQGVANSVQISRETKMLVSVLQNHRISFCILKGMAAAIYYPKPAYRQMGDVDFIVPVKYFNEAKKILDTNGYVIDSSEENNPRHIVLRKNSILFEMHHYFGYDGSGIDYYIDRCWDIIESDRTLNAEFPRLPQLENGLVLLEHFKQHLHSGVGIRQLLDWMMYVHSGLDDDYWFSIFQKEARNLGTEKLAVVSTHLCQMYLGLSLKLTWCSHADEMVCEKLLENIIQSGNFGINNGNGKAVEKTIINLRKHGMFKYLQKAGEYNWDTYHRHTWLKPFAWVYQIGRYIRQGIERKNGIVLGDDLARSSERFNLLKELDLL